METKKMYVPSYTKEINKEERSVIAYASTPIIDRHGEVIPNKAWKDGLDNFRKHPVVFINHNYNDLWIGAAEWIKTSKDGLLFKVKFASTPDAMEAFQIIQDTDTAAFSVGARSVERREMSVGEIPKEWNIEIPKTYSKTDVVVAHTKMELLEISLVSLPAVPTAVLKKGIDGGITSDEITKRIQDVVDEYVEEHKEDEPTPIRLSINIELSEETVKEIRNDEEISPETVEFIRYNVLELLNEEFTSMLDKVVDFTKTESEEDITERVAEKVREILEQEELEKNEIEIEEEPESEEIDLEEFKLEQDPDELNIDGETIKELISSAVSKNTVKSEDISDMITVRIKRLLGRIS